MQERATRRLLFPRTRHLAPQTDCESRSKYKDGRTKAGQIRSKRTGRHRRKKGRGGHVCHIRRKREVEKESSRGRRNKTRKNERDGRKRELQLNHTRRTGSGMRRCRKKKEGRRTKERRKNPAARVITACNDSTQTGSSASAHRLFLVYKSVSSSSSSGTSLAAASSAPHCAACAASICTSGGNKAGASTNVHVGSPVSLRVM